MRILWTAEALDDLEEILAYYYFEVGPATAEAVERRIVSQVEALCTFSERIRKSDRIPNARELVISKLPYIVFVRLLPERIIVLIVAHAARKFPA